MYGEPMGTPSYLITPPRMVTQTQLLKGSITLIRTIKLTDKLMNSRETLVHSLMLLFVRRFVFFKNYGVNLVKGVAICMITKRVLCYAHLFHYLGKLITM